MSQEGLRVTAFAIDPDAGKTLKPEKVKNLAFVGFYGMKDALRSEVAEAMQKAMSAGIRVVMMTGAVRRFVVIVGVPVGMLPFPGNGVSEPRVAVVIDNIDVTGEARVLRMFVKENGTWRPLGAALVGMPRQ